LSDFHPELWNPLWSVSSILTGVLSFMVENSPTLGSMQSSAATRRQLAQRSMKFNVCNKTFVQLFPKHAKQYHRVCQSMKESKAAAVAAAAATAHVATASGDNKTGNALLKTTTATAVAATATATAAARTQAAATKWSKFAENLVLFVVLVALAWAIKLLYA
jgi:hypothetical protein